MENLFRYDVPENAARKLLKKINQRFKATTARPVRIVRHYYDSFDWRLYKNGLSLHLENNILRIVEMEGNKLIASQAWTAKKHLTFHRELQAGPLQERLKPILAMRALLPLAKISAVTTQLNILNQDIKCVVRLSLEQLNIDGESPETCFATLTVTPVRGYDKEVKKVKKFIIGLGTSLLKSDRTSTIFKASGLVPCSYSTKVNTKLSPNYKAGMAAVAIYKSQVAVMEINEAGVKADLDTEFLHDFRVAMRRTRSGLSQFKGIFSPEITALFKKELAMIGKMSNRMRDLDVYLLEKNYYRAMLPVKLQPKIDHLFELLQAERTREKRNVIRKLNSVAYQNTMEKWKTFLENYEPGGKEDGPNASQKIGRLARKYIFKTWVKTINQGRLIEEDSGDEELHKLRLTCKKLRYLLEFFTSLFPKKDIRFLVKQLKKLQDNLGHFNDICVQQDSLQDYLEHQVTGDEEAIDVAAAIGGLVTNLGNRQQEVRLMFYETFDQFDCAKNNHLFKRLFHNGE